MLLLFRDLVADLKAQRKTPKLHLDDHRPREETSKSCKRLRVVCVSGYVYVHANVTELPSR